VPYVASGEQFEAEASIIAGIPPRRASLGPYLQNKYDPLGQVAANDAVDRYAAVKSLPFLPEKKKEAVAAIEKRLDAEKEDRVLLEAAGAGAALGSEEAWARIGDFFVWGQERDDLRMEAVFILKELGGDRPRDLLVEIATDDSFAEDEIRQAAVWSLGKTGLKRYVDLLPFLKDAERDVVLHAIAAFGTDTPDLVIDQLIAELLSADKRHAPAASEALRLIGNDAALKQLIAAAEGKNTSIDWILATLGRFPADKVRTALKDNPLLDRLGPLLLLSNTDNWLAEDTADIDLKFLFKQNL
jgi:HEAT repeat protein